MMIRQFLLTTANLQSFTLFSWLRVSQYIHHYRQISCHLVISQSIVLVCVARILLSIHFLPLCVCFQVGQCDNHKLHAFLANTDVKTRRELKPQTLVCMHSRVPNQCLTKWLYLACFNFVTMTTTVWILIDQTLHERFRIKGRINKFTGVTVRQMI